MVDHHRAGPEPVQELTLVQPDLRVFRDDLAKFDIPTVVMHGEDDQIVPVKDSAHKTAQLVANAQEIYYPGAPHGMTATLQDQVNNDLLAFLRS